MLPLVASLALALPACPPALSCSALPCPALTASAASDCACTQILMPFAVDSSPLPAPGCNAIAKTCAKACIAFAFPSVAGDYW